ncbi:MAG: tRNA lysidine(34) synthetase TilS [Bacteroidaceae bacterium]|nr:tRNA lysidine(34) synthetase TilS [Bacteroidaceae bacterium]
MREVLEKVRIFIRQHHLLQDESRVVVGLSGGSDSVCLAHILDKLGYEVVAAHCNFHLRGEESMRDEQFVVSLCQQMGWNLHQEDFDTAVYARQKGISIEMAAREYRYDWFKRLKEEVGAEAIAVGHHQDDNVETLLLNLTRGTGIKGLCGMQPKNGDVVRPLLCLTRKDILIYLEDVHQTYVTDHTNLEDDFARNKVRLDVLPLLETINQGAMKNLASTQENLTEVMKVYQQAMQDAITNCVEQKENGEIHIDIQKLQTLPSPISVLHEVLSPFGFNKVQLKDLLAALNESGKVFIAAGRRVLVDRQYIIVEAEHYPMPNIHMTIIPVEDLTINKDPHYAYLDADKLKMANGKCQMANINSPLSTFNLQLSTPKEGDTFAPFGMGGKRKLLSDFLTDLKLSLFEKERQPLLVVGNEIAWVIGRRSSELYRVDETTKWVLILSLKSSQR